VLTDYVAAMRAIERIATRVQLRGGDYPVPARDQFIALCRVAK
jgi:hypothetical protein